MLILFWGGVFGFFGCTACGILIPQPVMEPTAPTVQAQGLNHGTTREVAKRCCSIQFATICWFPSSCREQHPRKEQVENELSVKWHAT